ncbi:hypothetical protein EIP86_000379 [Pleurotus ostreatoroseus]|nr:hypothetical protein EIP86_000379 [Pleurotus ostreatoroseus]
MTWKVCTKVASFLEQGQRLENLSWRLWHLQNLMVDTENAKSKREFKQLSKCMGDKLDKEKGRSIEELQAPGFRCNHSTDLIQQRAVEREKECEANNSGRPGTHSMQFTISIKAPTELTGPTAHPIPAQKPEFKPSAEFKDNAGRRGRPSARAHAASAVASTSSNDTSSSTASASTTAPLEVEQDKPLIQHGSRPISTMFTTMNIESDAYGGAALRFPSLFSNDFGPAALLYPTPTLTNVMTYGEGLNASISSQATATNDFSVSRPTIELGLDELLNADSPSGWVDHDVDMKQELEHEPVSEEDFEQEHDDSGYSTSSGPEQPMQHAQQRVHAHGHPRIEDDAPRGMPARTGRGRRPSHHHALAPRAVPRELVDDADSPSGWVDHEPVSEEDVEREHDDSGYSTSSGAEQHAQQRAHEHGHARMEDDALRGMRGSSLLSQAEDIVPRSITPSRLGPVHPANRVLGSQPPTQDVRATRMKPSVTPARTKAHPSGQNSNGTPDDAKAECSNCGANHTSLWRRGPNDELNCNACGLYYKTASSFVSFFSQPTASEEFVHQSRRDPHSDSIAEGTAARWSPMLQLSHADHSALACGLYLKFHGKPRPIDMKSDIIRKRARRKRHHNEGTISKGPSASLVTSLRASPVVDPPTQGQPDDSQARVQSQGNDDLSGRDYLHGTDLTIAQGFPEDYSQLSASLRHPYEPNYAFQASGHGLADTLAYHSGYEAYSSCDDIEHIAKRPRLCSSPVLESPSATTSFSYYGADSSTSSGSAFQPQNTGQHSFYCGTYDTSFDFSVQNTSHVPTLPPDVNKNIHLPMLALGTEDEMDRSLDEQAWGTLYYHDAVMQVC